MIVGTILMLLIIQKKLLEIVQNRQKILTFSFVLPIFILFFSHMLYVLSDFENFLYTHSFLFLFKFWEAGYMVYGGLFGVVLCCLLFAKRDSLQWLDSIIPAVVILLLFFRVSEGFLGQGYGEYWEGDPSFFNSFPFMIYDKTNDMWAWSIFILEAFVLCIIYYILNKTKTKFEGERFLLFLGLYASMQIVLESLRRDEFLRWGFVRVEQLISALVLLIVFVVYTINLKKNKSRRFVWLFAIIYLVCITGCVLLEFALEERVYFLRFLDINSCYYIMSAICLLLAITVLHLRRVVGQQYPRKRLVQ